MSNIIKSKVLFTTDDTQVEYGCLPETSSFSKLAKRVQKVISNIFTFLTVKKSVFLSHNLYDDRGRLSETNYHVLTKNQYEELEERCKNLIPGGFEIKKDRFGMASLREATSSKALPGLEGFRDALKNINKEIEVIRKEIERNGLQQNFSDEDVKPIDINAEFDKLKKKNSMGENSISAKDLEKLITDSQDRIKKLYATPVKTKDSIQINKKIKAINETIEAFKIFTDMPTFPKLTEIKGIKLQDVLDNSLSKIKSELLDFKNSLEGIQNAVAGKIRDKNANPLNDQIDELTKDISHLGEEIKGLVKTGKNIAADHKQVKNRIFTLQLDKDFKTEEEEAEYISKAEQTANEKALKQDELTSYTNAIRDNELTKKEIEEYNGKVALLTSEIDKLEQEILDNKPIDRQKLIEEKESKKKQLEIDHASTHKLILQKESELKLESEKKRRLLDSLNMQFITFVDRKRDELKDKTNAMNRKIERHNESI
ncbi:MAG: hypothetical protein K1000chlam1_00714 [Candidatus Anoxychlamydiales bacterium]|nr:hypothetical protein [Candidatus Anoxychlamydiales bacterium]